MFLRLKDFLLFHKKKIIIAILLLIILILFIVAISVIKTWKSGTYKTTTFVSSKKDFSITLPDTLEMNIYTNESYDLLVKSVSNKNVIAVSAFDKIDSIYSFGDIINADKSHYIAQFQNVTNISDVSAGTLNKSSYNFHKYSFETNELYVEVYWVEFNNKYYIFDFANDKNSSIDLKSSINSILETLEFTLSN